MMMLPLKENCRYNKYVFLTIGTFLLFTTMFYFYVHSEKEIDKMNELRVTSHELIRELEQSSDDLTQMSRMYVISHDPIYKKNLNELLAIREGKSARRNHDYNLYMDLAGKYKDKTGSQTEKKSILQLIENAGFSESEIRWLNDAKLKSDRLAILEREAMGLIDIKPYDEVHRQKAIEILFSQEYDKSKADIMQSIYKADSLMDIRTADAVNYAKKISIFMLVFVCVSGVILFFVLWRSYEMFTKINSELEHSKKKAEEAEAIKSDFMANMSHEIRTPLNAIVGFVNLLSKSPLNQEQAKYISILQNSIDSLLVIVNDILDFSKIAEGKQEIEYVEINPVTEFEKACVIFEPRAKDKLITYQIELDKNLAECILIDFFHVKQVMLNLISNAIKFTPDKGEISIKIKVIKDMPESQLLRFSVKDSGTGIEKDKLGRIFEKFTQADISTTRKFGGTGLGLSISHSLVEMMGGSLNVESTINEGSYFYFDLNVEKSIKGTKVVNSLTLGVESLEVFAAPGLNVLVAEDQETNQFLIGEYLKKYRVKADFAHNGEEAVGMVAQKEYDLILMDINMPVMDGMEATTIIRQHNQDILIVALTAHVLEGDYEKFMSVGMNEYLTKPISVPALEAVLRHVYEQKNQH